MFTRRAVSPFGADEPAEFTRIVEGRCFPPPCAREGCREDTCITPQLPAAVINRRRPSN
jgi:hypothetical protein